MSGMCNQETYLYCRGSGLLGSNTGMAASNEGLSLKVTVWIHSFWCMELSCQACFGGTFVLEIST